MGYHQAGEGDPIEKVIMPQDQGEKMATIVSIVGVGLKADIAIGHKRSTHGGIKGRVGPSPHSRPYGRERHLLIPPSVVVGMPLDMVRPIRPAIDPFRGGHVEAILR